MTLPAWLHALAAAAAAATLPLAVAVAPATFSCGTGCTARIEPWCADSLRIRMSVGGVLEGVAGALHKNGQCGASAATLQQGRSPGADADAAAASGITNGGISASWSDGVLRFMHSDSGAEFLASSGPIADAFSLTERPAPAPGPPTPAPYACQDSCTLGATGISEQTDAEDCVAAGKLVNISRAQCCSTCSNNTRCVAFAWGRDSADKDHRHNCYLCAGLSGTRRSPDRDFGCVERSSSGAPTAAAAPTPLHRTNFTYFSTSGAFTSARNETIVGLGQRSHVQDGQCDGGSSCGQWKLNQKGFSWPLGITKYQIAVPFYVSSCLYGLLWNAPGEGQVSLLPTQTSWNSTTQRHIDFWVTAPPRASASPIADIMTRYADATGHAPLLPTDRMGFWQSKMRYRSGDELVDVAQGFATRQVPLDVLVIDFYSWSKFGDFHFDYRCWPNASGPSGFVETVRRLSNDTRILHSTYPWVDQTSENYDEFAQRQLLALDASTGLPAKRSPAPGGALVDPFLPAARQLVWDKVRAGYFEAGIEMFWLDDTEPNIKTSGIEWGCGLAEHCGALWPNRWIQTFTDGLRQAGVASPVMLTRAGWAGMQSTGAVLWSSDIPASWRSLQIQVRAGLATMMSGIPWWTTDVGGFSGGDATSADYRELITRWYQYGAFCPIFRTHGDRERPKISPLPTKGPRYGEDGAYCTAPGGHAAGGPNEFWAFGNETATRLVAMIRLRYTLIPYIERLAQNVSSHGAPPQRPLFYDFPAEPAAWAVDDQFMFGPDYLVAPVLEAGARSRNVYFPGGPCVRWRHYFSGVVYEGGSNVSVAAPLDEFPLFSRMA